MVLYDKTIKCRKCGKVYPFDEKYAPYVGYDIPRRPKHYLRRDRAALGLDSEVSPL
ncbi:MAG: hypothetical protein ACLVIY_11175 [Anaerobutyricum soehngenii]